MSCGTARLSFAELWGLAFALHLKPLKHQLQQCPTLSIEQITFQSSGFVSLLVKSRHQLADPIPEYVLHRERVG